MMLLIVVLRDGVVRYSLIVLVRQFLCGTVFCYCV